MVGINTFKAFGALGLLCKIIVLEGEFWGGTFLARVFGAATSGLPRWFLPTF